MARLPQPGSDKGTWGDVLNDYLSQSHNVDGTLKDIAQAKITNLVADLASREPAGLSSATQTTLNQKYATNTFVTKLRSRDLPPLKSPIIKTATTLPIVTSISSGTSTITNSIQLRASNRAFFTPNDPRVIDQDVNGYVGAITGPISWEWDSDSPLFEIHLRRNNSRFRIICDGELISPSLQLANDGGGALMKIDWSGVRQSRHYRLEGSNILFRGVNLMPSDSLTAAPAMSPVVVWGDSFTEPTIVDNTGGLVTIGQDGFPFVMGRALGLNIIASGSGGTGLLNPGTSPKVKLRDRIDQEIALNPIIWFIFMGINDANRVSATPSYTAQMEYTEALSLFNYLRQQLPDSEGHIFSPWCSKTPTASLLGFRDAIKQAAEEAGYAFHDLLGLTPTDQRITGTVVSQSGSSMVADVKFRIGDVVQIGKPAQTTTPGTVSYRTINGVSGTGPWTHTLDLTLSGVTPGTFVSSTGRPWSYGSGNQGSENGTGPSDFLIGTDATHPTLLGHQRAGMIAASLVQGQLSY